MFFPEFTWTWSRLPVSDERLYLFQTTDDSPGPDFTDQHVFINHGVWWRMYIFITVVEKHFTGCCNTHRSKFTLFLSNLIKVWDLFCFLWEFCLQNSFWLLIGCLFWYEPRSSVNNKLIGCLAPQLAAVTSNSILFLNIYYTYLDVILMFINVN